MDTMFWVKSLVGSMLMPLPLGLLLIAAGVGLLFRRGDSRSGRWLVLVGLLGLIVASVGGPARWLAEALEERWPGRPNVVADESGPRFVVVLGGGHRERSGVPVTSQLVEASTVRLVEGVRLWRTLPDATLVVTGTVDAGRIREPEAMADLAIQLGVPPERIIKETRSLDTADHARYLQAIVGREPFLLVTSALHLPRAMLLLRNAGLQPIAAPAGRLAFSTGWSWLPSARSLERSTRTAHEVLGLAWATLVREAQQRTR